MGMFDTLKTKVTFVCPNCDYVMDFKEGLQTKLFDNNLTYFIPGDILLTTEKKEHIYIELEQCDNCNQYHQLFIATVHGIYIETFSSETDATNAIESFDIVTEYRKQNNLHLGFKSKFNRLRFQLSDVLSFYMDIKKYKTNILRLRNLDDVLDYDIFKTIENIIKLSKE